MYTSTVQDPLRKNHTRTIINGSSTFPARARLHLNLNPRETRFPRIMKQAAHWARERDTTKGQQAAVVDFKG